LTVTVAPWEAGRRTIAAPIPRMPPVTRVRLPARLDASVVVLPLFAALPSLDARRLWIVHIVSYHYFISMEYQSNRREATGADN
jgi:hypothetical protein